jgi:fatty-acid desaturase
MSRAHKISNLVGVLLPFLAFVAAIVLLWNTYVDWSDLAVLAIMYVLTGYGVTLGFHRCSRTARSRRSSRSSTCSQGSARWPSKVP